jgi:hypothetical protein
MDDKYKMSFLKGAVCLQWGLALALRLEPLGYLEVPVLPKYGLFSEKRGVICSLL